MIIVKNVIPRNLIFEGNSLSNLSVGSVDTNSYYIPLKVYNALTKTNLAFQTFARSGRTQTQINSDLATNIYPILKSGDIIVLWELTNDIKVNGATGQQAYDNIVTYSNAVRSRGAKLVLCTMIARDYATDTDEWTRGQAANALIRANAASICDVLVDLALDSHFDTLADCSNGTYYLVDKLHQVQGGQDIVADTYLTPAIQALL